MIISYLVTLLFNIFPPQEPRDISLYLLEFERIDNRVDVLVNDSIVFASGTIDHNPVLEGYAVFIGDYFDRKKGENEVIIRVYNGHEPYDEREDDAHWMIKFVLKHKDEVVDKIWESNEDNQIGLVNEFQYFF